MSGKRAKNSRKAEALRILKSENGQPEPGPRPDPWRMIATIAKAEENAHLIVPGPIARSRRDAYMMVACGKGWLLRAVRKLDEPSELDTKCSACLAASNNYL